MFTGVLKNFPFSFCTFALYSPNPQGTRLKAECQRYRTFRNLPPLATHPLVLLHPLLCHLHQQAGDYLGHLHEAGQGQVLVEASQTTFPRYLLTPRLASAGEERI